MSLNGGLSPAGSSSYSSNTMHVGDGTWDSTRDDFLLPNIQGLNYATMRYNGMGNRFRSLPEYHNLITGHGVLAAITFLGIVPAAILLASFYHRNPRRALRLHISLQILTVILATIILVLGYFAVGPSRSLTNPHHGIGVAIYVLVLLQALGGWLVHRIEKGKTRYHLPIKLMLHQWLGRAIALLAFAQIPIGLTLYGSPLVLFILYAITMFALLVLYFVLTYQRHRRAALGFDERGSYVSGTRTDITGERSHTSGHNRFRKVAAAIGAGTAISALRNRRVSREPPTNNPGASVVDSRYGSSYMTDSYIEEKHNSNARGGRFWGSRLVEGVAGISAFATLGRLLGRSGRENESVASTHERRYAPQLSQDTMNLNTMEEGRPMRDPAEDWRGVERREAAQESNVPRTFPNHRRSQDSVDSYAGAQNSLENSPRRGFVGMVATGGFGSFLKRRRERKERRRIQSERQRDYENERLFGRDPARSNLQTGQAANDPDFPTYPPPPESVRENGYGQVRSQTQLNPSHIQPGFYAHESSIPPARPSNNSNNRGGLSETHPPPPPPPPVHREMATSAESVGRYSSNSHQRTTRYGAGTDHLGSPQSRVRHDQSANLSPPPPIAMSPSRSRYSQSGSSGQVESPPVSVKVKMQNDGRHVTVRRLNSSEAAMEREARRTGQAMVSSSTAPASTTGQDDPFNQAPRPDNANSTGAGRDGPPPPSMSPSSGPRIREGSTGTIAGTDTTDYNQNRRRRRAERAKAEQARQARSHGSPEVEFT